jgi:hypothetical protein
MRQRQISHALAVPSPAGRLFAGFTDKPAEPKNLSMPGNGIFARTGPELP